MAKGSQNKDTAVAYEHALKSIGKTRPCNGIFHKGYPGGEKIDSSLFKRMGDGYQFFCSDCDQARQSFQKTLKRLAALVMVDNEFRIKLPQKFLYVQNHINELIDKATKQSDNPLEVYTSLVEGDYKIAVKDIGFYETNMSVDEKKEVILLVNSIIRRDRVDDEITKMVRNYLDDYYYKCSMCNSYYPLGESLSNHSQSRNLFSKEFQPTNLKCPVHNLCLDCSSGRRADSIRQYHYLCNGDFFKAQQRMTEIGKNSNNLKIHADHIVPLRLGGKHDPINLRPLGQKDNIFKKDKITKELLEYLKDLKIDFKDLLTDWYHEVYEEVKTSNEKVIEAALRNAVDRKREAFIKMTELEKRNQLRKIYPTLNNKNLDRIIRKSFNN
jgi:hypothetical protein